MLLRFRDASIALVLIATVSAPASAQVRTIPLAPYLRAQASLHANINGHDGTFMFDTGEGVTTITPAFARTIGCTPWGLITGYRMSGERLDVPHCDNLTITANGRALHAPTVGVLDIMHLMGDGVPPIDGAIGLDLFAGQVITIVPRHAIIVETPGSLRARLRHATELPVRLVRDAEGTALSVNGAVPTPQGIAWMELDTGNGGANVIANHIAPLLNLAPDVSSPIHAQFTLANGIVVDGNVRTRDLIMDGNIGAQFLNNWVLTLDLDHGRAWLTPAPS